jgi:hypothetical protein
VELSCLWIRNTETILLKICMMLLVVMFLPIINKQFSFHSKVKQNVLESRFKQDQIFVAKDISLIYCPMVVQDLKLEFKVYMRMLLETPTEDILLKQLRKHLHLPRIVPTKLLLI